MKLKTKLNVRIFQVAFLTLFLVWQRIEATRIGYDVEKARRQTHELQGRIGALNMETEADLAPAHLALLAHERGMFPATPDMVRVLPQTPLRTLEPTLLGWLKRAAGPLRLIAS